MNENIRSRHKSRQVAFNIMKAKVFATPIKVVTALLINETECVCVCECLAAYRG